MTGSEVKKIAFLNICTKEWIAGCNYLQNLFLALRSLDNPPKLFLLNTTAPSDESYRMLLPIVDGLIDVSQKRSLIKRVHYSLQKRTHLPLGSMNPIEQKLRENDIDILFASKSMGQDFKLPSLIWIPDLQHIRLPEMFPEEERKKRDRSYKEWVKSAQTIIVSSQEARNDMETFMPESNRKISILRFVAHLPLNVYELDSRSIADRYHLPEKFFYLPNQFWKHKNHSVVIKALGLLRDSHPEINVVCSGNTLDYRQPNFFNSLLTMIAENGVHEQFRVLGSIPYEHIFQLMRQSLAVIQPSLFEGWSTTVEETKSLGKHLILSDIPVHREQDPSTAVYFEPDNPKELARYMIDVFERRTPGPDYELESKSRAMLNERLIDFGSQFMSIVQNSLSITNQ